MSTAAIIMGTVEAYVKLGIATVLQFGTAPLAGHVMGRAAYRSGVPLWSGTIVDDLAHVREHRRKD
jgi:multicomponent Na+:H+ antiporter subunit G